MWQSSIKTRGSVKHKRVRGSVPAGGLVSGVFCMISVFVKRHYRNVKRLSCVRLMRLDLLHWDDRPVSNKLLWCPDKPQINLLYLSVLIAHSDTLPI